MITDACNLGHFCLISTVINFTNMVAVMDPNLDRNMYNFVAVNAENRGRKSGSRSMSVDECTSDVNTPHSDAAMVRSVAMSANVASIVKDEVRHLIRVSTLETDSEGSSSSCSPNNKGEKSDIMLSVSKEHGVSNVQSACSHILPEVEGGIVCGVILSRWDDIVGPQSVHAWLHEIRPSGGRADASGVSQSVSMGAESRSSPNIACSHQSAEQNAFLMKAVKYVTSHTVNYTGLQSNASMSSLWERESNFFVVPDLGLIAQSLVFHARTLETTEPFSLAILVEYQFYDCFLHLRGFFHQWLRRMAERLQEPLLKCLSMGAGFGAVGLVRLNTWVLELWHTVFSLGICGLGNILFTCGADMLNNPLLERALTSHLQTFCCSVVMGTSSSDINALISFFALFLDPDEKFCSRLVLPTMKYSYHIGLFVQGLLLDEFGCRELSSMDLAANPYPVTAIDLTKGQNPNAVRQTPPHCLHQSSSDTVGKSVMHSILCPVKESANLVCSLLKDMRFLPPCTWQSFIDLFKRKLTTLAHLLLSFTHHSAGDARMRAGNIQQHVMKSINLQEADFLIVLAVAEKLKPGIYDYIMELER